MKNTLNLLGCLTLAALVVTTAFALVALKGAMDKSAPEGVERHYSGQYDNWEEEYDQAEAQAIRDDFYYDGR